jgi:undecaprenyl-diphosphatase
MHDMILNISNLFQSWGIAGLYVNALIESCLPGFPLPPDVLLIGMCLTIPQKALLYALICTTGSITGALVGYMVGRFGGRPLFYNLFRSKADKLEMVDKLFEEYGAFAVFFSAFSPIPYNIFAIASGITRMNVLKFLFVSCLGRGGRFFFVSIVLMLFGETIKQYMNYFIIGVSVLLVAFFVILYKKRHSITGKKDNNIKTIVENKPNNEASKEQEYANN